MTGWPPAGAKILSSSGSITLMPHSSDETKARSPFSAHTMERSFNLSLSAIRPPSKPKIIEKGPFMRRDGKALRRNISWRFSSSLLSSIVDQKEADITFATSSSVRPLTLRRKSIT